MTQAQVLPGYSSVAYAWRLGYFLIPSVLLWRRAQKAFPKYPLLSPAVIVLGMALTLPAAYVLWAYLRTHSHRPSLRVTTWLTLFAILQTLMSWAAFRTWTFVGGRAHQIDDILNQAQHVKVSQWLQKRMNPYMQWSVGLLAAFGAIIYLSINSDEIEQVIELTWASYISVAVTTFLGANVCYWLWCAPNIGKIMVQSGGLKLRWYQPASTPGLRTIADGLGFASLLLLYGSIAVSALGFYVPRTFVSSPVLNLLAGFAGLFLVLAIRVAFMPFVWIYRGVMAEKRITLTVLAREIGDIDEGAFSREKDQELIELYQSIYTSPNLPFSTAAMVQYVAVLMGSIIAVLASVVK